MISTDRKQSPSLPPGERSAKVGVLFEKQQYKGRDFFEYPFPAWVCPLYRTLQPKLSNMELKDVFIHHVYFWLHQPDSKEDLQALLDGLHLLSAAPSIHQYHIGIPADTRREVIDSSYSVSWMLIFNSKQDQDSYQVDPIHLNFVEQCAHLWRKVVVYDSINVKA